MRKPCYHYRDGYCYSEDVIRGRAECPHAERHPDDPELVFCTKESEDEEPPLPDEWFEDEEPEEWEYEWEAWEEED